MHPVRWLLVVATVALAALYADPRWRAVGYMPERVAVAADGGSVRLATALPPGVDIRREGRAGSLRVGRRPLVNRWQRLGPAQPADVRAGPPGRYFVDLGALGLPVRRVEVDALSEPRLVPGGESIGIRVRTAGLLVVSGADGSPWRMPSVSGLRAGDRIVSAGGRPVGDAAALAAAAQASHGGRLSLAVVRGGRLERLSAPVRVDRATGRVRLGIHVRQGLRGIGTLTFYDPRSRIYAALGHRIQDGWEGQSVPVVGGRITPAPIESVRRGRMGRPGEKIGHVRNRTLGSVSGSGPYGIFGRLGRGLAARPALPLATADEVHAGAAEMWTVVCGQTVERFRVRIERVDRAAPGGRGLVVRVVDPRLIARAGGIVQGMSGSPIIQDGRLAGALTHVLVSDSRRGYGVFAAWMWREALEAVAHRAGERVGGERAVLALGGEN